MTDVVQFSAPDAKWFIGGKTNMCYNCVDLQIERGRGDHPAILWGRGARGGGQADLSTSSRAR
jgi:acyl-coenzyme A synthetase/AMP-(fatty) acid ligase